MWRIDVAELQDGGQALIWRLHHALADGTTAIRLARAVLFDNADDAGELTAHRAADDHARRRCTS